MSDERIVELLEQTIKAAVEIKKYYGNFKPAPDIQILLGENDFYLSDEIIDALKEAVEIVKEDKVTFLQCVDGRLFIVDSKKSLEELESKNCKKCKRIDELKEIRMENNNFLNKKKKINLDDIKTGSCKDCVQCRTIYEPLNNSTIYICEKGVKSSNKVCLDECMYFEQRELKSE